MYDVPQVILKKKKKNRETQNKYYFSANFSTKGKFLVILGIINILSRIKDEEELDKDTVPIWVIFKPGPSPILI